MNQTDFGGLLAEIVEAAAAVILPIWGTALTVVTKTDQSPVTIADQRGEALILERLSAAFPGVPVIAEEEVSASGAPPTIAKRFFLVDPLDGTKAFVRGEAHFTVNVGLIEADPGRRRGLRPSHRRGSFTAGGGALKRQVGERGGAPRVRVRVPAPGDVLASSSHTLKPEQIEALEAKYGFTSAASRWIYRSSSASSPRAGPTFIRATGPPWSGTSPPATRCWPPPADGSRPRTASPSSMARPTRVSRTAGSSPAAAERAPADFPASIGRC